MSARSTIGFGNPYRFNTSSSSPISISNSANDACRKCWFCPCQPPGGFGEILHRLLVDRTWLHLIPGMHRGQLFHFLVAVAPSRDLLICAKDLFFEAIFHSPVTLALNQSFHSAVP